MKLFVVGVGLIGGSMAMDLRKIYSNLEIIGVDNNSENLKKAIALGIIDRGADFEQLSDADRIIVSVPVKVALQLLPQILDRINETALVWDVGSTKHTLCKAIENHPKRNQFLAAHPIAGTEFSGPEAAITGLFDGKPQILCETEKTRPDLLLWAEETFSKMGMYLRLMKPKSHDKHMAYVSHLSHVSSFMLGKTVLEIEKDEQNIFDLAGSGFESTVRLAKSSPDMWTPIFEQNKKYLTESLTAYIDNLNQFKKAIESDDYKIVYEQIKSTNQLTQILNGIKIK